MIDKKAFLEAYSKIREKHPEAVGEELADLTWSACEMHFAAMALRPKNSGMCRWRNKKDQREIYGIKFADKLHKAITRLGHVSVDGEPDSQDWECVEVLI